MAPRDEERPGEEPPKRRPEGPSGNGHRGGKDVPRGVTHGAGDERGAGNGGMPRGEPRIGAPQPGQPGYVPPDGNGTPDQTHYGRTGGGHQVATGTGGTWVWWPAIVIVVAAVIYLLSRLGSPG